MFPIASRNCLFPDLLKRSVIPNVQFLKFLRFYFNWTIVVVSMAVIFDVLFTAYYGFVESDSLGRLLARFVVGLSGVVVALFVFVPIDLVGLGKARTVCKANDLTLRDLMNLPEQQREKVGYSAGLGGESSDR